MTPAIPARSDDGPPHTVELIVAAAVLWLAAWTLAVHAAAAASAAFRDLVTFGATAATSAALIGVAAIRSGRPDEPDPAFGASLSPRHRLFALGTAAVALAAYGLLGFAAFWPCAAALVAVGAWRIVRSPASPPASGPGPARRPGQGNAWAVIALCVAGAATTLLIHRPDIDDGFYLSVAADALRRPEAAVWGGDTLMGLPHLPVMLPVYRVESHELLVALLARLTGTTALTAAHTLLPPIMAAFAVLVWTLLAADLERSRWAWLVAATFAVALLAGEAHLSPGNFAFVRLHQGKAVLASTIIPALYHYGWRWATTGAWRDALLLGAANVTALGMSSTAIVLAPIATLTAVATGATLAARPSWRTLGVAGAAAAYPLLAGLLVRRSMLGVQWLAEWPVELPAEVTANVLGPQQAFALLGAVSCGWALARDRRAALRLLAPLVVLVLFLFNPLLAQPLADRVLSPSTYWRVTWVVPWLVWTAAAVVAVAGRIGRRPVWVGVLALSTLGWHPVWRSDNGARLGWGLLKVQPVEFAAAERIAALTPAGRAALAPRVVASWIATLPERPPLVVVRPFYTASYQPAMTADDVAARNELGAIAERASISEQEAATLLAGIGRFDVGALALRANAAPPALGEALRRAGFVPEAGGPYVFWRTRELP